MATTKKDNNDSGNNFPNTNSLQDVDESNFSDEAASTTKRDGKEEEQDIHPNALGEEGRLLQDGYEASSSPSVGGRTTCASVLESVTPTLYSHNATVNNSMSGSVGNLTTTTRMTTPTFSRTPRNPPPPTASSVVAAASNSQSGVAVVEEEDGAAENSRNNKNNNVVSNKTVATPAILLGGDAKPLIGSTERGHHRRGTSSGSVPVASHPEEIRRHKEPGSSSHHHHHHHHDHPENNTATTVAASGQQQQQPTRHHHHHSRRQSENEKEILRRKKKELFFQQRKPNFGSRMSRIKWVVLMWLPIIILFLHRETDMSAETSDAINTESILISALILSSFILINEFLDGLRWPYYFFAAVTGFAWGSALRAIQDLTAARLICSCFFGISAGQLRYHWSELMIWQRYQKIEKGREEWRRKKAEAEKLKRRKMQLMGPGSSPLNSNSPAVEVEGKREGLRHREGGGKDEKGETRHHQKIVEDQQQHDSQHSTTDDGSVMHRNTYSGSSSPTNNTPSSLRNSHKDDTTPTQKNNSSKNTTPLSSSTTFPHQKSSGGTSYVPTLTEKFLNFLALRLGIAAWFGIGELLGCSAFVPGGMLHLIPLTFWGYCLLLVFPIAVYKISSWLSHFFVLIFGTKTNIVDASRLLAVYWISTAILSISVVGVVVSYFVASIIPYVWSLQFLVGPYGIVTEFISFESRKVQESNPYSDMHGVYKERLTPSPSVKDGDDEHRLLSKE